MKHDLELQLRRDARAIEEDAPNGMTARVRGSLARESANTFTAPRMQRRALLVAATILLVAGGTVWSALSSHGPDQLGRDQDVVKPTTANNVELGTSRSASNLFPLTWPTDGIEMATRAGEPLAREWEHVKSDSITILHGFERQIPRL